MKKSGINININIQKKHVWFLGGLIVFLAVVGFVVAFGGTDPTIMGHDAGELEGVQKTITGNCNGRVMVGIDVNGAVICEDDDAGVAGIRMTSGSYVGNRVANRPIAHGLGVTPNLVMITTTNTAGGGTGGGPFFRIYKGMAEIFRVTSSSTSSFSVSVPDSTNFYVGLSGEYSETANTGTGTISYHWVAFG